MLRQRLGRRAEDRACAFLERRGLRCLDRNVRCRHGELDLVMRQADTIVFVEVRLRRGGAPVSALQSIGPHKQARLARAAAVYLARHPELDECPTRFDVVTFDSRSARDSALQWLADAFRPGA